MKNIVITGGSDGLGKTLAEELSKDYNLVENVFNKIIKEFGKIDILINNAGLWIQEELDQNDSERINAVVDVNLLGVINCSKAVIPNMKQNKDGLIININSQAGINHKAERVVYNASKWGVTGFSKSLQDEVAKYDENRYVY